MENHGPGFRRISSRMLSAGFTPKSEDAAQTRPNLPNSAITTPLPAVSWPIGRPHGASGAITPSPIETETVLRARQALTEQESRRLVAASLQRQLGSSPVVVSRSFYADDEQYDSTIDRIDLPAVSEEALMAAWRDVEGLCRPAHEDPGAMRKIIEELARTFAVTAGQQRQGVDDDLAVDTIADELGRYPVDCVLRGLWARRAGHRWRPALSELLADIQWRARHRQCLREAFERRLYVAAA